jgi:hypothetical protein
MSVYLRGKFVPWDEKTGSMPSKNYSRPRPSWRLSHALNQQNVRIWPWCVPKKKNYYVRSRNVYENKQNSDNLTDEMSDIRVDTTCFLQKITDFEGQIALNGGFPAQFWRNVATRKVYACGSPAPPYVLIGVPR